MNYPYRFNPLRIKNFEEVRDELLSWFEYCGYIRRQNPERRAQEGRVYKKGFEVRFVLQTKSELKAVRRLLKKVGLRDGAPFEKHSRLVLPVYGRRAVEWFVEQLGPDPETRGFALDGQRITPRPRVRETGLSSTRRTASS